jgi:dTDP-L-rhamnose 4-epimerase
MRVLVTGGSGFIGRHVVERLLAGGADVRVLDTRPTAEPRADLVVGDVTDSRLVSAAVVGVDAVCHLAARVGLGIDFGDAPDYVHNNDQGTAALLEAMWQRSFRGRLVLASSMVVYGEGYSICPVHGQVRPGPRPAADLRAARFESPCPVAGCRHRVQWAPVDEATPPDPRNVYAATKLHQEHLCACFGRETGCPVIALRYHNVYGPGMPRNTPYAGVASIFRSALERGQGPEVFEDGRQMRDFVHVHDVARANVLALTGTAPSGVYNIASGEPHTVGEMAGAMAQAFGDEPELRPIVSGRWRLGDVRHIVASPYRASDGLGFCAEVGFAEGMAELATATLA